MGRKTNQAKQGCYFPGNQNQHTLGILWLVPNLRMSYSQIYSSNFTIRHCCECFSQKLGMFPFIELASLFLVGLLNNNTYY